MKKVLRFKLFVLLLATTAVVSSCCKDNAGNPIPPPAETIDEKLNHWMFDYMKERYLWNDAVNTLKPDFSVNYNDFLQNVLNGVAAQGDVNHDDGRWELNEMTGIYERTHFFSAIWRYKLNKSRAVTRGMREPDSGIGIYYMGIRDVGDAMYFRLLAVSPGSPADKAGLKRGMFISRVNGVAITLNNWQELANALNPNKSGVSLQVTFARMNETEMEVIETGEVTMVSASYEDNPVWMKKIFTADNGDKVGYLCYHSFNSHYDQQLLDVFREFKTAGVKELILDLRYNGGGHLLSSVVLGTLIAGEAKKDQVFTTLIYNKTRTDAGETEDKCLIGNKSYMGAEHQLIADAMRSDYSLGLKRIYMLCTDLTASASELIINGMRGLNIDVHLIGTTTNGKNVGMEIIGTTEMDDGYEYEFAPITFYVANAKGFRDFSNGFPPDVEADEEPYTTRPWGAPEDPLLRTAMKWINDGVKPSGIPPVSSSAVSNLRFEKHRVPRIIKCEDGLEGMILSQPADQLQ